MWYIPHIPFDGSLRTMPYSKIWQSRAPKIPLYTQRRGGVIKKGWLFWVSGVVGLNIVGYIAKFIVPKVPTPAFHKYGLH